MKSSVRKWLSCVLAMTLLITCTVSGIVLPTVAEEANLIVNGDFEQGPTASWGNSAYIMDGVGVDGSKGIKIEEKEAADAVAKALALLDERKVL